MNWFRRKKETAVPGTVQLRSGERPPFGMLADYVPLQNGELQLYRAVREAVPVVDAAIYKLIRMTGGVRATCQDVTAQRQLQTFLRTVPTGRGQQGINAFLDCYLDSLLVCGRAIGEIVPARGGRDIGREVSRWSFASADRMKPAGWCRCRFRTCCSLRRFIRRRSTPTACR